MTITKRKKSWVGEEWEAWRESEKTEGDDVSIFLFQKLKFLYTLCMDTIDTACGHIKYLNSF